MPVILLIDDDEFFRETLAEALGYRGFVVRQAGDGESGLKFFRAQPADLVLTDVVMPNQDGTALFGALRRDFPGVGIIAMSGGGAHNPELYLKIADRFGADRTLLKPFDLPTLLTAIAEVLAATGGDRLPS